MEKKCVWVATADMGYGHMRAADPFSEIACERIILINNDAITPRKEQKYWRQILYYYEAFSRAKRIPVIGNVLFGLMNLLLKIPPADVSTDLSMPTFQVKMLRMQIKNGLCGGLTSHLSKHGGTLLTSFYAPAIAADMQGIKDLFCIICDSDLNRVWVAEKPENSSITYFSPCHESTKRLLQYGVANDRIISTGFPLHPELIGSRNLEIARDRFLRRMEKLENVVVAHETSENKTSPLTITFAIGGAGAQTDLAKILFDELYHLLINGTMEFTVIAGVRRDVRQFFEGNKKMMACKNFKLVWSKDQQTYFRDFTNAINQTDILISKPSEISFYAGLGIPFIIAPPIGAQEEFNRLWLLKNQSGVDLPEVSGFGNWLLKNIANGNFARIATNGYKKIEKGGFYKILDHLAEKKLIQT